MNIDVKIEGLDKLTNKLNRISSDLKGKLQEAVWKSGDEIARQAKKLAPVGQRREGSKALATKIDARLSEMTAEIAPWDVEYAIFVHEGTRPHFIGAPIEVERGVWRYIGMHPGTQGIPFMTGGVEMARPVINQHFESVLNQLFEM